jgi:hypothetical protein
MNKGKCLGALGEKLGNFGRGKQSSPNLASSVEGQIIIDQLRPKPGQRLYRWNLG